MPPTTSGTARGMVVFAGYGISSPAQKHDDYAGLDVKGRIVLIASGTPQGVDASMLGDAEQDSGAALATAPWECSSFPASKLRRW